MWQERYLSAHDIIILIFYIGGCHGIPKKNILCKIDKFLKSIGINENVFTEMKNTSYHFNK